MILIDTTLPQAFSRHFILASQASPGKKNDPDDGDDDEQEHLDELLDEALDDTFPASDPVALTPRKSDADDKSDRDDDRE